MSAAPARAIVPTRLIAAVLAIGTVAVGLVGSGFRDDEGFLTARFVLPLTVAAGFALMAAFRAERLGRALFWLGLALFGQAVSLQLVQAGNAIGYQHHVPYHSLLDARHLPAIAFLAIEAVAVIAGLRPHARGIATWFRALGPVRSVFLLAAFALPASALAKEIDVYVMELVMAALVQAMHFGAVALAAASLPADITAGLRTRFRAWFGEPSAQADPGGADRFVTMAALFALLASALLAFFAYERHPHVPDEVIYILHARYFAEGMLTMAAPPVPEAFNLDLMAMDATRWYSPVPLGWPAMLAVGAFLGAIWLVNPVLNGINVLLAYLFLRELYSRRTARIGILLLAVSPWFVFMGMNFMTHTWTLTCALAAALFVARLRRLHDAGRLPAALGLALPAGIAIGVLGLIRPLEGLTVALLLGVWALFATPVRWRILPVLGMAAVAMLTASITFPYNRALSGDPRVFPLMAYTDSVYGPGTNALGFGANRGLGWPGLDPFPGHGVIDIFVNAALNTFMVNIDLLGWAAGSLLPLACLLVSRQMRRPDALMFIAILAIVGVHSFYWFSGGPDFGARYWYLILVPCIALTARGLEAFAHFVRQSAGPDAAVETRTLFAALALSAIALVTFVPWRAIDKYHHYRGMRPGIRQLANANDLGRVLVLVRGERHPDYASAGVYNPVDLSADAPVYIWDHDPGLTRRAVEAFPDREIWIVDGPTRTGADYRIVEGPVPRGESADGTAIGGIAGSERRSAGSGGARRP